MMEITIHIPGLMELAEALKRMNMEKCEGGSVSAAPVNTASVSFTETLVPITPAVQQAQPQAAPVQPAVSAPVAQSIPTAPAGVPTSAVEYTLDDLARAAMTLMDSGRQPDLLQLLSNFGVSALPALPKEQYGAFATALRGMGAQI